MKYKRNENITAIQWDGTSDGVTTIKKEMPGIEIPWFLQYVNHSLMVVITYSNCHTDGDDPDEVCPSLIIKKGDFIVRIEDYLGYVEYRTYSKECFEDAFTKE